MNLCKKSLIEEAFRRFFFLLPSNPQIAQIEITNRCNLNCRMCQRKDLGVPMKDMEYKTYKKIIDKLGSAKEVILTGWGEPLLHPKIIKMILYAKKKNLLVSLTTNAILLNEEMSKRILDSGLDSISFSVDTLDPRKNPLAHKVYTQQTKIEKFMELRKKQNNKIETIVQITLHKEKTGDIFSIIAWAEKLKVSLVNINRLDVRFNKSLQRPNFAEEKEFVKKLNDKVGESKIQVDFRPHTAFGGIYKYLYHRLLPFLSLRGKHCLRIYNYVYINQDFDVTPCCGLPKLSFGNLLKDDLKTIWNNNNSQNFKNHKFQRKICGRCDVLEINQYA